MMPCIYIDIIMYSMMLCIYIDVIMSLMEAYDVINGGI